MSGAGTAAYRLACVALARSWAGLDARGPTSSAYRDVIARGETPAAAASMATMSSCALVGRGYLARVLARPPACVLAPYRTGRAVADLHEAAHDAGAILPVGTLPERGDLVLVEPPEHVWICTSLTIGPTGWPCESIEGGERDSSGYEQIGNRDRVLVQDEGAAALWDEAMAPRLDRRVVEVYSLEAMADFYGAADASSLAGA